MVENISTAEVELMPKRKNAQSPIQCTPEEHSHKVRLTSPGSETTRRDIRSWLEKY